MLCAEEKRNVKPLSCDVSVTRGQRLLEQAASVDAGELLHLHVRLETMTGGSPAVRLKYATTSAQAVMPDSGEQSASPVLGSVQFLGSTF